MTKPASQSVRILLFALCIYTHKVFADDGRTLSNYLMQHAKGHVTLLAPGLSLEGDVAEIGSDYICIKQAQAVSNGLATQCVPFSAILFTAEGNRPGITINLRK